MFLRIIPLLIFLISSCVYEPSGDFFLDIPEKDYSGVTVNLNTQSDTLFISTLTSIIYTMEAQGLPLIKTEVKLGEKSLFLNSTGLEGNFYIDPSNFTTGKYTLTVSMFLQSGSGSLADGYGKEIIVKWKSIPVVIDTTPPDAITIAKIDTTNGTLVLHWKAYNKWNFQDYTIVKECSKDNFYFQICNTQTITDKSINEWRDENFVGGIVRYRVDIRVANNTVSGLPRNYSWIPQSSFVVNNGQITVSWPAPLFYQNIKQVSIRPYGTTSYQPINIADTSFTAQGVEFGSYGGTSVLFKSEESLMNFTFEAIGYLGTRYEVPATQPSFYHSKTNTYYGHSSLNGGQTLIMNGDLKVIDYAYDQGHYFIRQSSNDGKYFITYDYFQGQIFLHDTNPITLELTNSLDITNQNISDISVSNNGLIACSSSKESIVIDWSNHQILWKSNQANSTAIISPDGNFVLIGSNIYQYLNGGYQLKGSISSENQSKFLFTKIGDLLVTYPESNSIKLWSSSNASVIKSINLSFSPYRLSYDEVADRAMVYDFESNNYLVNVYTDAVKKILSQRFQVTLVNGKLFAPIDDFTFLGIDYTYFE